MQTVTAHLQPMPVHGAHTGKAHMPPAVLWLKPLGNLQLPAVHTGTFVLAQKNRMFSPHLLIVPVGSAVQFPNRDPFFHNVFSLFEGRRFDLGLYEAGKTKEVVFSREGVSYIFCNIHPEMSAVVISLTTPLFGTADANGMISIAGAPAGDYELHLWAEGASQSILDQWTKRVHVSPSEQDLGTFSLPLAPAQMQHLNKFGQPYAPETNRPY